MAQLKPQKIINTLEYLELKSIEDSSLDFLKKKQESVKKQYNSLDKVDESIEKSYNDMTEYSRMYSKIYEQEELANININESYEYSPSELSLDNEEDFDDVEKENNSMLNLGNLKLTVTLEDVIKNKQHTKKSDHLKSVNAIEDMVNKGAKQVVETYYKGKSNNSYQVHESNKKDFDKIIKEKDIKFLTNENIEPIKKSSFEKNKFLKASWFMKIGHYIGLSLRNQYYESFDKEIIKALDNNEVYKVLEAQKNGYYLGKKLNKLTMSKLCETLSNNPNGLLNELVQRDILLSYDHLSLIIFSKEGTQLINNQVPEEYPYAKTLIQDLLKKENFLFANKSLWLNSLKDKELFLKETNPLFYHDKMLAICETSELLTVKKVIGEFLQQEDVLKSISKNKLIDKMLLKLDILLGNSVDLDHMVLDLPQTAQSLYKSIKEIKFNENDLNILQQSHSFDYDLVEKRMPEAVIKYLNVDTNHRSTLKNQKGKTAENLLVETLENILLVKKDLNLFVNQAKISELSVTRRYTDSIRGDIGKPSLFTLKTLEQLKSSGELIDLSNEVLVETFNNKNSNDSIEIEAINETKNQDKLTTTQLEVGHHLSSKVKDVRMSELKLSKKKMKI